MTPSQILDVVAISLSLVSLAIALYRYPQSTLRPRYLVSIPRYLIDKDDRDQLRKDLTADSERDYVFVEIKLEGPVQILEIK